MFRLTNFKSTGSKAANLLAIFSLLLLSACSKEQEQASIPPAVQEQPAEPAALEKIKEVTAETVEKAKATMNEAKEAVEKAVDGAMKQSTEAVEKSKQALEDASTATKKSVSNAASSGVEKTKAAIAPAMDKATKIVEKSTKKISEINAEIQEEAKLSIEQAGSVTSSAAVEPPSAAPAEIIVLENNFGSVTLTHAFHGKTYGCTTCHGVSTPGPFELTKDLAHSTMCKDCHKSSGGPTGCTECHIK